MDLVLFLNGLSVLLACVGTALVVVEDRRIGVGLLAGEYLGVAGLLTLSGQPAAALSRVGVGVCAVAILLTTLRLTDESRRTPEHVSSFGQWFRLSASLLLVTSAWGLSAHVGVLLPGLGQAQAAAGVALLALGLLHLGLTEDPLRWIFALISAQLGFEVMYAVLEPSLAVQAILAGVHLGILLVGSDIAIRQQQNLKLENPGE